jgi:homocysteine S-methyltransferase
MREGVALAVRERDGFWGESTQARSAGISRLKPLVAASMGPFGACLFDGSEYHGNYRASWKEVSAFHRERMLVLAEAGADLLAFETIPSLAEAEILLELLEKHVADLHDMKAWISFSCKDETRVSHGESFNECIAIAAKSDHVACSGINCTPPGLVLDLLQSLDSTALPLVVYPNSGETWEPETNCWLGQGSTDFDVDGWYDAGTRIFGGCCRTRPADITGIRAGLTARVSQVA